MVRRLAALLLAAALAGCGGETTEAPLPAAGRDVGAVPPEQMRQILEGLRSKRPRLQYAALETLSRFPPVAQAYRSHVERLEKESPSQQVRRRAAELLRSLEQ
ncbi:MAG TPA: hypothetical protein EYP56_17090 [Planctomycetaceae bacterium]|nr:hypothetical protein [Planctomycetaceae bacterium]